MIVSDIVERRYIERKLGRIRHEHAARREEQHGVAVRVEHDALFRVDLGVGGRRRNRSERYGGRSNYRRAVRGRNGFYRYLVSRRIVDDGRGIDYLYDHGNIDARARSVANGQRYVYRAWRAAARRYHDKVEVVLVAFYTQLVAEVPIYIVVLFVARSVGIYAGYSKVIRTFAVVVGVESIGVRLGIVVDALEEQSVVVDRRIARNAAGIGEHVGSGYARNGGLFARFFEEIRKRCLVRIRAVVAFFAVKLVTEQRFGDSRAAARHIERAAVERAAQAVEREPAFRHQFGCVELGSHIVVAEQVVRRDEHVRVHGHAVRKLDIARRRSRGLIFPAVAVGIV